MSRIDPEVLYLILTKVAAQEGFYNYDPKQLNPGQLPGTITYLQLGDVYKRITSQTSGPHSVWTQPLSQLGELLKKCGLPPLGSVVVTDAAPDPAVIQKIRATSWPRMGELKALLQNGRPAGPKIKPVSH